MALYSMDLRTRVSRDADAEMPPKDVRAEVCRESVVVNRVKQWTGEVALRQQTIFRRRTLTADQGPRLVALITARPDAS